MPHLVIKRVVSDHVTINPSDSGSSTVGEIVDKQLGEMATRFKQMPAHEEHGYGIPQEIHLHIEEHEWFELVRMYGLPEHPSGGVPYNPPVKKSILKRPFPDNKD